MQAIRRRVGRSNYIHVLWGRSFANLSTPTYRADGYCRGEATAVVVLKPLADAIAENDNILGVVTGSAANQNHSGLHITVPQSRSQVELYQKVMQLSRVTPDAVSYVEAHGTGSESLDSVLLMANR